MPSTDETLSFGSQAKSRELIEGNFGRIVLLLFEGRGVTLFLPLPTSNLSQAITFSCPLIVLV